ncbi:MAG: S9 family peptidase [Rhodothermales bacterium]
MRILRATSALLACLLVVTSAADAQQADREQLTLEDIHASGTFVPQRFQGGSWAEEGPVITFVEEDTSTDATHLYSRNLETQARERLIDGNDLYAADVDRLIRIEGYQYSPDRSRVLIYTDSERVWRYNTKGYYYVYDREAESLKPLARRADGFQMFAKFSPDGRHVGFVRNRDLFAVDLDDMELRRLTDDGSEGGIINGTSDWVYEEEFGLRDGWAWGPGSDRIAYVQLDESSTREFTMQDLRGQYPELIRFRYPKAGETNSEIHVGVVDVATGERRFFDTGTWFAGGDSLEYVPSLGWTPDVDGTAYVWFFRLNRDQNRVDVVYGDPSDMSTHVVLREENDTWIDVETSFGDLAGGTITYLDDDRHFVWLSERDDFRHLYLYRNDGTLVRRLTQGDWNVTAFHGVDRERNAVYFTATEASPLERHLYSVPFDASSGGSVMRPAAGDGASEGAAAGGAAVVEAAFRGGTAGKATAGAELTRVTARPGHHNVSMSRDLRFFIDRFTDVSTPLVTTLHTADGDLVDMLEGNEALQERLERYALPYPEFTTVPADDGTPLHAYLIKPTDFDSTRSYPLLMHVYGGPGSQTVEKAWGGVRYLWHAYLAERHGVIVAGVDNRGTGGRSKSFKSVTYARLGTIEAQDQVAAARHLSARSYIDADRTGIWGWSYGGYLTLMSMLTADGPSTFEVGAAVAPVTDWRQYDTIYTERFMSTPRRNEAGYEDGAPTNYADRLRESQDLLIIHGDLDDNVHFQNTTQMVDALQGAGKQFDVMFYPGRDHGIFGGGTRLHLYTLMTRFITERLITDNL